MAWCFEDEWSPDSDALIDQVRDEGAIVPALWKWEVANVLSVAARRQRIRAADVALALQLLSELPIEIDQEAPARAWRETLYLAEKERLSVYDSAYLELAMRLNVPLATTDKALRRSCEILGLTALP
jgi:predicted nucleic acid-binding protein